MSFLECYDVLRAQRKIGKANWVTLVKSRIYLLTCLLIFSVEYECIIISKLPLYEQCVTFINKKRMHFTGFNRLERVYTCRFPLEYIYSLFVL